MASRLRCGGDVTEIDAAFSPDSLVVGTSWRMHAVFDYLRVIEGSESNVLIMGETGTGKEAVARFIHRMAQICHCNQVRSACMPASMLFHSALEHAGSGTCDPSHTVRLDDRLHDVEASLITWALGASGGNKSKAAELLQIKRSTLGERIRRLGLVGQGGVS